MSILLLSLALGNVVVAQPTAPKTETKRSAKSFVGKHKKAIIAAVTAAVLGGACVAVYKYVPAVKTNVNKGASFVADNAGKAYGWTAKKTVAGYEATRDFTKKHYVAVPLVTGGVILVTAATIDLLRKDKSLLKKFAKAVAKKMTAKKAAAADASVVSTPAVVPTATK